MRRAVPRTWERYKYFDARKVLVRLGRIEEGLVGLPIPGDVMALRTHALRKFGEQRQGALFCFGLSCYLGCSASYAPVEDEDFDCIARWSEGDGLHFAPVQLKELPPESLNPRTSLESELAKLSKYADGSDLAVAYYLNRQFRLDLTTLAIPRLSIGSLWFFGGIDSEKERWMICGDLLANPRSVEFEYPA